MDGRKGSSDLVISVTIALFVVGFFVGYEVSHGSSPITGMFVRTLPPAVSPQKEPYVQTLAVGQSFEKSVGISNIRITLLATGSEGAERFARVRIESSDFATELSVADGSDVTFVVPVASSFYQGSLRVSGVITQKNYAAVGVLRVQSIVPPFCMYSHDLQNTVFYTSSGLKVRSEECSPNANMLYVPSCVGTRFALLARTCSCEGRTCLNDPSAVQEISEEAATQPVQVNYCTDPLTRQTYAVGVRVAGTDKVCTFAGWDFVRKGGEDCIQNFMCDSGLCMNMKCVAKQTFNPTPIRSFFLSLVK